MQWTLTPLHEVLTVRQAAKALRDTKMTVERLPLLKYSDAAIQQLISQGTEVKLGDIIRITRHSFTSKEVYYYRRVVV
jgi:DNA-directed RNA polymerase subunit H (RpoH/RPB5)